MVKFRFVTPGRRAPKKTANPVDVAVGALLAEKRREAGLTQRQVAAALHANHWALVRTETGERRIDVVEVLILLKLYGVDVPKFFAELLEGLAAPAKKPATARPTASLRRVRVRRRVR